MDFVNSNILVKYNNRSNKLEHYMSSITKKVLHHVLRISDTTPSTSDITGALTVEGGLGVKGDITVGGTLKTSGSQLNTSVVPSTSSATGSFILSGGLGISNTTNAVDYTSGGAATIGGGVAIGKRLFVDDNVFLRNLLVISATGQETDVGGTLILGYPASLTVTTTADPSNWQLAVQPNKTLSVINRSSANIVTTAMSIAETGAVSVKSKQNASLLSLAFNREDRYEEMTFSSAIDVVSTATNITGLVFSTSRAFVVNLVAFVSATVNSSIMYELRGILNGVGTWEMTYDAVIATNDVPIIDFSITSGGQVQYSKVTTSGHTFTVMKWRAKAIYD